MSPPPEIVVAESQPAVQLKSPAAEPPAVEPAAVEPPAAQPEAEPSGRARGGRAQAGPKSDKMNWYILKVQSNREESIREGLLRRVAIAGLGRFSAT